MNLSRQKPLLSIIIVNYNSKNYLLKCLASINEYLSDDDFFEVLIVNNSPERLVLTGNFNFSWRIIEVNQNIGFGRANNLAAKQSRGEFLFFLNPDTQLIDDSLELMLEEFQKNKNLVVIGPRLIHAKTKKPEPWTCGRSMSLFSILFKRFSSKPWENTKPTLVDWVSGTALLTRKKTFKTIYGFDKNIFMYFEDQDLCLRAKKLKKGNEVLFFPSAQVIHHSGKSWKTNLMQKRQYRQAQKYFFKKHRPKIESLLLRLLTKISKLIK